jgi:hypothetical protein
VIAVFILYVVDGGCRSSFVWLNSSVVGPMAVASVSVVAVTEMQQFPQMPPGNLTCQADISASRDIESGAGA